MASQFYKDKVVLVTGGTGLVGTHLLLQLIHQGCRLRVPIHRSPPTVEHPSIETFPTDLSDPGECEKACRGVDFVFHASGSVGSAGVGPMGIMESIVKNLVQTAYVMKAAWGQGVKRFLLFGSTSGYSVVEYPVKEEEMWSGNIHPSYFGYGWMRRYLERLGEFVHSHSGMKVAVLRPTAVYGSWDRSNHVIPALIARAFKKEDPFVVWGSGEEVRDFVHAADVARACLIALEKHAENDPINIGYGKTIRIKELVGHVLKLTGHRDASVVFDASKPTTIPFRMVDTAKAKKILGFETRVSLEEGLKDAVEWRRKTNF